jgi:sugar lactone lactonase YvrE
VAPPRCVTTLADGLLFPEGPRWHGGVIWIADMLLKKVLTCSVSGALTDVVSVPCMPAGLGFLPDGDLLITSMADGQVLRWNGTDLRVHADLSRYGTGMPGRGHKVNDMVVDGRGNAYVGVYAVNGESDNSGIVLVRPNGSHSLVADHLALVNGMAVSPDGRSLVAAELGSDVLTAYDIASDGSLSGRGVWARIESATPDGICLDAEGAMWVASVWTSEFLRVARGGEVLERLSVPGRLAMAPMLGGPDRKTLFLMTAECTREELLARTRQPRGLVQMVHVEVPGAGWP